jgi:hypothetical protein
MSPSWKIEEPMPQRVPRRPIKGQNNSNRHEFAFSVATRAVFGNLF